MLKPISISIITTTWKRHKELINVIELVKNQKTQCNYEHIIVSDGYDDEVEQIGKFYQITTKCIKKDENQGSSKGHLAKDIGIALANGLYICLWDDDNHYYNTALEDFNQTMKEDIDIGVHEIKYYKKNRNNTPMIEILPKKWDNQFICGDIDTMNLCVCKNLAKKIKWSDNKLYEGDFIWIDNLSKLTSKIKFKNSCVGVKL